MGVKKKKVCWWSYRSFCTPSFASDCSSSKDPLPYVQQSHYEVYTNL